MKILSVLSKQIDSRCYNGYKGKSMLASDLICDRHKYIWKGREPEEYYGQCHNCDQRIDRIESAEIKVGDLVRIKKWCKNKGRLASVVDVMWFDTESIIIQYLQIII